MTSMPIKPLFMLRTRLDGHLVIPAKAGIQPKLKMDSRLRGVVA